MELNKYYTWDDLAENYPDMWVFYDVKKTKKKDGILDKVFVLAICPFAEKSGYVRKFRNIGIRFNCERTTDHFPILGFGFWQE